jgi:fermentation-respiration switch protein FrsA (DUF1100 family)
MSRVSLADASERFEATLIEGRGTLRFAIFSVGGGGNPERHLPLLESLAERGVTVIAPHFDRLLSPRVTANELLLRARRLRLAIDAIVPGKSSVSGLGHSIGSTVLLAMAGGQAWMGPGAPVSIERDERLKRLVLLTPATGFFQAPGALDGVQIPILTWVGTKDTITSPAQGEMLKVALENRVRVDLRIEEGAGHFSFMHSPPPNVDETHSNREAFLERLTAEAVSFARA